MNIDLSGVEVLPVDAGGSAFHSSLGAVLEHIAPLAATAPGLAPEEHLRRLAQAINVVLDRLEELTGMADPQRLPALIDRVAELAVTGDNVEVPLGVAGDLRVSKRHRLVVDEVVASFDRVPRTMRAAAVRESITALQRLLALLLLHGWTDSMGDSLAARQAARRAIVDTVQGHLYAGQSALGETA